MKFRGCKKILSVLVMGAIVTTSTLCSAASTPADNTTTDVGQTMYTSPSTVQATADGGQIYTYDIDGTTNVFPVAPANFNPLAASAEELEEYGFPARPTDPAELSNWKRVFSHYKRTVSPGKLKTTEVNSTSITKTNITNNMTGDIKQNLNGTIYPFDNDTWAGYYADSIDSSNNNWVAVEGEYTQPRYDSSRANYTQSHIGSWVGLGGHYSPNLAQAGTETYLDNTGALNYDAWYEVLPAVSQTAKSKRTGKPLQVAGGNEIYVYVSFETANNKADFYILNETTGDYSPNYISVSSSLYSGSSADWIDEKPTILDSNNQPIKDYLLDCDDVQWKNCHSYSAHQTWYNLGTISYHECIMHSGDPSYQVIMAPSNLPTNAGFTDHRIANIF